MADALTPVPRPRAQARRSYDRIAPYYDLVEGRWERAPREAGLAALAAAEGERILEVGPGPGHALLALARAVGPEGRVVGADLSGRMLGLSRRRLQRAGLADAVDLVQADAVALPFASGTFDAVFTSFALELFDTPDLPRVVGEWRRLLAPGGRVAVVSLFAPETPGRMVRLYDWGHRHFPSLLDCRPLPVGAVLEDGGLTVRRQEVLTPFGLPTAVVVAG